MDDKAEAAIIDENVREEIQEYERQIESVGDVERMVTDDRSKKTEQSKQFLDSLKNFRLTPGRYEAFSYLVTAMASARHDVQKLLDSDFLQMEKQLQKANVWSKDYELAQLFPKLMSNRMNTSLNDAMIIDIYSFAFQQLLQIIMNIGDILENEHPEIFESLFSREARLDIPMKVQNTASMISVGAHNGGRDVITAGGTDIIDAEIANGGNGVVANAVSEKNESKDTIDEILFNQYGKNRPLYVAVADLYKRGYKPKAISDMLREKGIEADTNTVGSRISYAKSMGIIK